MVFTVRNAHGRAKSMVFTVQIADGRSKRRLEASGTIRGGPGMPRGTPKAPPEHPGTSPGCSRDPPGTSPGRPGTFGGRLGERSDVVFDAVDARTRSRSDFQTFFRDLLRARDARTSSRSSPASVSYKSGVFRRHARPTANSSENGAFWTPESPPFGRKRRPGPPQTARAHAVWRRTSNFF